MLWSGVAVGLSLGAACGFALGLVRFGIGMGLILGAVVGWAFQTALAERHRQPRGRARAPGTRG